MKKIKGMTKPKVYKVGDPFLLYPYLHRDSIGEWWYKHGKMMYFEGFKKRKDGIYILLSIRGYHEGIEIKCPVRKLPMETSVNNRGLYVFEVNVRHGKIKMSTHRHGQKMKTNNPGIRFIP